MLITFKSEKMNVHFPFLSTPMTFSEIIKEYRRVNKKNGHIPVSDIMEILISELRGDRISAYSHVTDLPQSGSNITIRCPSFYARKYYKWENSQK